jgi:hypothetical protein
LVAATRARRGRAADDCRDGAHLSLQGAADELNRSGLTTARGEAWHAMQVSRARRQLGLTAPYHLNRHLQ